MRTFKHSEPLNELKPGDRLQHRLLQRLFGTFEGYTTCGQRAECVSKCLTHGNLLMVKYSKGGIVFPSCSTTKHHKPEEPIWERA
jgi:hypothetical protein